MYKPEGPFIVIDMPLNADGEGPEMNQLLVRRIVYEIWDSNNATIRRYNSLKKAERVCHKMNVLGYKHG